MYPIKLLSLLTTIVTKLLVVVIFLNVILTMYAGYTLINFFTHPDPVGWSILFGFFLAPVYLSFLLFLFFISIYALYTLIEHRNLKREGQDVNKTSKKLLVIFALACVYLTVVGYLIVLLHVGNPKLYFSKSPLLLSILED